MQEEESRSAFQLLLRRESPPSEETYSGHHNYVVIETQTITDPRPHTVPHNSGRKSKARRPDRE